MNVLINSIVKGLVTSDKTVDIEAIVGSLKGSRGHGSQEEGRGNLCLRNSDLDYPLLSLLSNTLSSSRPLVKPVCDLCTLITQEVKPYRWKTTKVYMSQSFNSDCPDLMIPVWIPQGLNYKWTVVSNIDL